MQTETAGERQTTRKPPVYIAAEGGHVEVVEALLELGADPNALATIETPSSTSRTSPLFAARRGGHKAVEEALERHGAREITTGS